MIKSNKNNNKRVFSFVTWFLSMLALSISFLSYQEAKKANQYVRRTELLDIDPKLKIEGHFQRDKAVYIFLKNLGLVNASQIVISFNFLKYYPETKGMGVGIDKTEWTREIGILKPQESINVDLPSEFMDICSKCKYFYPAPNSKPSKFLPQNTNTESYNVIEIKITYVRECDRKLYTAYTFYFLNTNNEWVAEDDKSMKQDLLAEIKDAIFNNRMPEFNKREGDPLHIF